MVVFDANFLIYFLDPKIQGGVGTDPRIDYLVETIQKTGDRIIVPTPALSELLVKAGDAGPKYLEIIARSKFFRVAEFGERAAVEAAALTRDALARGGKRGATPAADWGKVKFDRQIVAIARVVGATVIYTTDDQLASHAKAAGLDAVNRDGLPEPTVAPQIEMNLAPVEPVADPDDSDED
ncbi:MAG: PIN domain-containing protein [Hyphomicrobiaceae bacterium]